MIKLTPAQEKFAKVMQTGLSLNDLFEVIGMICNDGIEFANICETGDISQAIGHYKTAQFHLHAALTEIKAGHNTRTSLFKRIEDDNERMMAVIESSCPDCGSQLTVTDAVGVKSEIEPYTSYVTSTRVSPILQGVVLSLTKKCGTCWHEFSVARFREGDWSW